MTLWTIACQAPLSIGFSRQEYWSGLPCPPPGDFPNPGIEPVSLMSPALAGRSFITSATWEAHSQNSEDTQGNVDNNPGKGYSREVYGTSKVEGVNRIC